MPSVDNSETVLEEDIIKEIIPLKIAEIVPIKNAEIGIIYPPPEVRNIVDKTASFVARNGPEFESRIRQNELNNVKFNFLAGNDPYNAYYQHKVSEFKAGRGGIEPAAPKPAFQRPNQGQVVADIAKAIKPLEPPAEFEFIAESQTISAYDLDVVKLTAQFTARNGREFLTSLINQQQRNFQFDFLRPQHSLFTYFTKLVEQYTKILLPPKNLMEKLKIESDDQEVILEQVNKRVSWERQILMEKNKEEEAKEKERVAYAQIDWHSFVVVETVDYQSAETGHLPPPTTPEEVGARVLAQQRFEDTGPEMVEMEVESSDDEDDISRSKNKDDGDGSDIEEGNLMAMRQIPNPAPAVIAPETALPPAPEHVIVRKDYDPKGLNAAGGTSSHYLISPITGEKIRADLMTEHMRIALLDPRWTEQRDRIAAEKRERRDIFAPGSSIDSSLRQLADRRTDIFGYGNEEKNIGEKIGDAEDPLRKLTAQKMVWDGHSGTKDKVSQSARDNITAEDKLNVIKHQLAEKAEQEKIGVQAKPPMGAQNTMIPPLQPPRPSMPPMGPPMGNFNRPLARMPMQMNMPPRPPVPYGMPPQMGMGGPPPMGGPPMGPRMGMPPMNHPQMGMRPPPPQNMHNNMHKPNEEPPMKKSRTEDSLIPEAIFLQKHQGNVTFDVCVPNIPDKSEWKLGGQRISLTLSLTDTMTNVKAKLHEILGMPSGKQKIQFDGMFVKDTNTLAFYNVTGNSSVHLQIKERGGRKK